MHANEAPKPVGKVKGEREGIPMIIAIWDSNLNENQLLKSFMVIPQVIIISSAMIFCFQSKIWLLDKTLTEKCINSGC